MGTNRDERPPTLLQQAEVLGLIGEVIAPFTGDLEQVSNKLWVRRLSDEHWGLLEIAPWKGASHSLTYGVCCSWVPHIVSREWRWHRTIKQSRPDLLIDHRAVDAPPQVFISRFDSAGEIRRSARRALDAVRGPAEMWWASVSGPAAVAAEAERQAAGYQFGYYFGARITAAFTHARLGELARAKQSLIEIDPASYGPARLEDGLAKLEIVAAGTHLRATNSAAKTPTSD